MAGPLRSLYLVLKGHWVSLAVLTEVTLAVELAGWGALFPQASA